MKQPRGTYFCSPAGPWRVDHVTPLTRGLRRGEATASVVIGEWSPVGSSKPKVG
jgi:hypothetical protein